MGLRLTRRVSLVTQKPSWFARIHFLVCLCLFGRSVTIEGSIQIRPVFYRLATSCFESLSLIYIQPNKGHHMRERIVVWKNELEKGSTEIVIQIQSPNWATARDRWSH